MRSKDMMLALAAFAVVVGVGIWWKKRQAAAASSSPDPTTNAPWAVPPNINGGAT